MAVTMKKAVAEDVNVTFEDQQKINIFARNTSRITELKDEIEVKKLYTTVQSLGSTLMSAVVTAGEYMSYLPTHRQTVLINGSHSVWGWQKQLQNLEDACDDIMMLDDSLLVPYQIGDVFISHSQEDTQEMLEAAKKGLEEEMAALQSRVESIQQVLGDLKVQLYAKFGNNINLEADDS